MLDLRSTGLSNESRPAGAVSSASLGMLFTHNHVPLSPSSIIWYQPMGGDAGEVTTGLAESNVSLPACLWLRSPAG